MSVVNDGKKIAHNRWAILAFGLFVGLGFAAMIVGISGAQLWSSFKGRYLSKAHA